MALPKRNYVFVSEGFPKNWLKDETCFKEVFDMEVRGSTTSHTSDSTTVADVSRASNRSLMEFFEVQKKLYWGGDVWICSWSVVTTEKTDEDTKPRKRAIRTLEQVAGCRIAVNQFFIIIHLYQIIILIVDFAFRILNFYPGCSSIAANSRGERPPCQVWQKSPISFAAFGT